MATDPRLGNTSLLALAAFRIQQRRQQAVPDWRYTEGLAALLAAARSLPTRAPFALPSVEECDGMERLLAEARLKGAGHGA
jgi:hypothetical protein